MTSGISPEEFRRLFARMGDAVLLIDDDRYVDCNPAAEALFSRSRGEIMGRSPCDGFSPDLQPSGKRSADLLQEHLKAAAEKGSLRVEWVHLRPGGEEFTTDVSLSRVQGPNGPLLLAIIRDISDRKQAEEALRQANRKLNLLASITRHDMMNRLTALGGYVELSRDMTSDPDLREIFRKEEVLLGTLSHQVRFAREYQEIGVKSPSWQRVQDHVERAAAGIIPGQVEVMGDLDDLEVYADPLMEKIFHNLVENAIMHGQATRIRFSFQETPEGLLLLCEDNGTGISADEKDLIFNRGYGRNTGLGLFLTREILAITGLSIRETGLEGYGARFEIHAPRGVYRFGA
ncbi:MAG: PAS domain S-box protein [Methanomicrobiales archaeon]|nr:PAS domain S-box protein [Methanomicrobiales archaeon]